MDPFKIEDIYNDGFEAEAEVIKQERAQVQHAQAAPPSPVLITRSPSKKLRGNAPVKLETPRQLVDHLPDAEAEAMRTFTWLPDNSFQNKQIGTAKLQEDSFLCDCKWDSDIDPSRTACGAASDCINRLTQVECPSSDCRCGEHCQNQRIQNKAYAPIKIVQTEKKGYGVMAAADLFADALIIEYIGEVIAHNNFVKRLRDYAESGIRHFYFMALQKDEYIDATKKGGRGRFLNHSCNPNCYVAKWVVGKKLRMAIFAKRKVQRGEELTFNYNVDRYGHEAQECFCGEPNCIGYIGGKTQTDLGNMDDLYLDALGITDEVEALGLKGNRKKKGLKLDEDFVPILKPMVLEDVPKVSSAIRQASSNKRILTKLLDRVLLTEDAHVQSQLMRLRGFSLMAMLLDEHKEDEAAIVVPVLRILGKWPLLTKNKISSTNVESLVEAVCSASSEEAVRLLAKDLLTSWSDLDLAYRIPKALQDATEKDGQVNLKRLRDDLGESILANKRLHLDDQGQTDILAFARDFVKPEASSTPLKKLSALELARQQGLPTDWGVGSDPHGRPYYFHLQTRESRWSIPSEDEAAKVARLAARSDEPLNDIISRAKAQVEKVAAFHAAQAQQKAVQPAPASLGPSRENRRAARDRRRQRKKADPVSGQEKQVLRAFTPVVVKALTKYAAGALDREQFKKRAKELTNLLVDKEKRREQFNTDDYSTLSDKQRDHIKSFTKSWAAKLLKRKGHVPHSIANQPSSNAPLASGTDVQVPDAAMLEVQEEESGGMGIAGMEVEESEDLSADEDDEDFQPDAADASLPAITILRDAMALATAFEDAPPPPPPSSAAPSRAAAEEP